MVIVSSESARNSDPGGRPVTPFPCPSSPALVAPAVSSSRRRCRSGATARLTLALFLCFAAGRLTAAPSRPVALESERLIGVSGNGPAEFRRPAGLAATPVGGVLVADTGNTRVQHLDLEGKLLWEAGGLGTAEGAMRRPLAVAAATSLAYLVLDATGNQVLEFHARGDYLGIGLQLDQAALTTHVGEIEPRGLAVDRSGNAIISDREGDRLLVFDPTWEFLYEVGGFGSGAQNFAEPEGLAVTAERLYVADSMNGRVQVLDALGGFLHSWRLPDGGRPVAVAVDRFENLFVADAERDRIVVLGPAGDLILVVGQTGAEPGAFRRPSGLCIVEDRLVVADADNDRLQVLRIRYDSDE